MVGAACRAASPTHRRDRPHPFSGASASATTLHSSPLSLSHTKMLEAFDTLRIMEFIGYAVMALLIIGTFSSSLTCVVGAKDLQCLFFATSTTAMQIGRVSTHLTMCYPASTLDIAVTAPPGPSPATGNRDGHYHYHYNDCRRVYYQNINSNNNQSTTYSNCYNDHSTRVYKGKRYVGDVNSNSVTDSDGFSFYLTSHLNLNFLH